MTLSDADLGLPAIVIAIEHYGRIARTLQKEMPVHRRRKALMKKQP